MGIVEFFLQKFLNKEEKEGNLFDDLLLMSENKEEQVNTRLIKLISNNTTHFPHSFLEKILSVLEFVFCKTTK